ncbi:MAG: hypothetical protein V7703_20220 [Hyphomicrobiales bacterium]
MSRDVRGRPAILLFGSCMFSPDAYLGILQILSAQCQNDAYDAPEDTIRETRASIVVAITNSKLLRFEAASGSNPINFYRDIPDADGHASHSLTLPFLVPDNVPDILDLTGKLMGWADRRSQELLWS